MNIKKILAAATASVLTVSAMAVVASADVLLTQEAQGGGKISNFSIDFSGLTEDQIKSIDKLEAKVSSNGNFFKGVIGYNSLAAQTEADDITKGWSGGTEISVGDSNGDNGVEGAFVREITAGDLAALNEEGAVEPHAEVQFWWVNGAYNEDGEMVKDATVCIKAVTLYAGTEVVATFGDPDAVGPEATPLTVDEPAESTPAESTPAESTPAESTGEAEKPPVETGVKGVAAVLGVAVVAAGAMVVAKKRK